MKRFLHLQSGEISGPDNSAGDGLLATTGPGHSPNDLNSKMPVGSQPSRTFSFGEKACGVDFNPGKDFIVNEIKRKSAELVDLINQMRRGDYGEISDEARRYCSKAISHIEDGQMNAVKARTWKY